MAAQLRSATCINKRRKRTKKTVFRPSKCAWTDSDRRVRCQWRFWRWQCCVQPVRNEWQWKGGGEGGASWSTRTGLLTVTARVASQARRDEFLRFMMRNWNDSFQYFPSLPPYSGGDSDGLLLLDLTHMCSSCTEAQKEGICNEVVFFFLWLAMFPWKILLLLFFLLAFSKSLDGQNSGFFVKRKKILLCYYSTRSIFRDYFYLFFRGHVENNICKWLV